MSSAIDSIDRTVGAIACLLIWALPSALFASLAAWGAYAYDKQTLRRWTEIVNTPTRHVWTITVTYHHGFPSIMAMSFLLGTGFFFLTLGCAYIAFALWES